MTCMGPSYCVQLERVLQEMRQKGIGGSLVIYGFLIDAYGKLKRFDKLNELMEEVERSGFKNKVELLTRLLVVYQVVSVPCRTGLDGKIRFGCVGCAKGFVRLPF